MRGIASNWIAWGLFGMVILYGLIKLIGRFQASYVFVKNS
jgi:hypothetical protein